MALWDQVLVDIDDNINFGTRLIATNVDRPSLYTVCTVATIQSREQVNKIPNVLASIQHSKVIVAIDRSVVIFEDETCDNIFFNTNFPYLVTCYCVDDFFLFVALANRTLCCFHILEKKLLSVIPIPDNQANISDNVIGISFKRQEDETFVILVSNTGAIYRVSLKDVTSPDDDKSTIENHMVHVLNSSQIFQEFILPKFLDAAISMQKSSVTAVGTNSVCTWPNALCNNFDDVFPFECTKIKPLIGSGKMLCLRSDHILSIVCPYTLLAFKICDSPVFDFTIIQYDNINHCEILFLTQFDKNSDIMLRLISYPEFKQRFQISVPATTYLFENIFVSDNVPYMEAITTADGIIDAFRIKMISESIPEMRLTRLLKKRQFAAAEDLANKCSLSKGPIYCSQAASLIEQLAPWTKSPDSHNMDTLINILDKIQNVEYITEYCSKAVIFDYTQMKQLYLYAQRRIMRAIKQGDDQLRNANLSLINDRLCKLETFQIIQDIEMYDDTANWIRFSQANLYDEFYVHLRMNQMKSAAVIWSRHLPDVMKRVSVETVESIFAILPEDTAPSYLWPWLAHFVPTLLSLLPDAIYEVLSWGLKKLRYLEISHSTLWPEIGADFAEKFLQLLKFRDNPQFLYLHRENSLLKQFMLLSQTLSDIQRLKIAHRLKVPLDIYINSPLETAHMLLDKIHLDGITDFLNTFLKRYIFNNNLQIDAVLCTYVQKTISNSNSWWFDEEAPWEKRVIVVTSLIHNVENQLETILLLLKSAPVPWSSAISNLAEINNNLDHDLSSKIKIERDYVPIKIVSRKYGYTTIDTNKLISRILRENRDSVLDDIDVLTKNNQQLKRDAFCRCVNSRLKEGNLHEAMDVVHHVENDITDALYCYENIACYIVAAFSVDNVVLESLDCWMEILDYFEFKISNLLAQSKVDVFRSSDIISTIKDLKSLYTLKKNYKINTTLQDFRLRKSFVLQDCIAKLIPNETDLLEMHTTIVKIAALLDLGKSHATLSLFKQTKDVSMLKQLVDDDDVYSNVTPSEFKSIHEICSLTLRHNAANEETIKIIQDTSALMLNICQDVDLPSALLLQTCVSPILSLQHCTDMKQGVTPESRCKLYTIYKDQTISWDRKLLSVFKDAIVLQLHYWDNDKQIKNYNEKTDKLFKKFLTSVKELQFQHNDYFLFQIFTTFYSAYCCTSTRDENTLMEMKTVSSQLLVQLLRKLCTGRSFDLQLGLACLFMLPEQEACNWISTAYTSFHADRIRHFIISNLGCEYSRLTKNWPLMQLFEGYKLLNIWAQRLSHYSIDYKDILSDASSKRDILQRIINSNKKNMIPLLKDYCCSFSFCFDDCLLLYLQTLVKTWNPTITASNVTVNKELVISKEEVAQLRRECEAIVAHMKNKSTLTLYISKLWKQINFYHYEVFEILMDLVQDKDTLKKNCLCFLQNYTRNGLPTSMEHYEWTQLHPDHRRLPSIAQWRLPFLLTFDIWELVASELNLQTYEKWLDIAPVLKLETHLVCTLAVKGEVTRVWGNNSTSSKNIAWSVNLKNIALLKNIRNCIQRITDSDGFYYGTAALYYVVNHTPPGADRVAAAKECYKYAQLAAQNSTKFEEGMLEKIESKYLSFTSEHILRMHGLEQPKYLALIKNPCKLIRELYNDESVLLRYRSATNYRPDINTAVKELGDLFLLNMTKLRLELLQEWLRSNNKYSELSQSFTEMLPKLKSDCSADYEDNLLRACYMLECKDTDLFVRFLISVSFGDHDGVVEYDYDVRYRALRILQAIVDTVTLEKLTKRDISTFRSFMRSLQYISKLESLGFCYNIDTFKTCCKRELVQILWKSQPHLPYVVCVVTQICMEFEIYDDILLWNSILTEMAKFRMVNELKRVLLQVRNVIVNCDGYKAGWQSIIFEPFNEMGMNPSSEQINNCVEAICLLYSYPMVYELDFSTVVRNCFQCKQAHLAVAFLPFLNESEKKFVSEIIKRDYQMPKLTEGLNYLSSKGVLTIARSFAIIQKYMP